MPAPAEGRRPRSRRLLSQEEILDAALDLLDEGGPNAASVRGIATRVQLTKEIYESRSKDYGNPFL